MFDIFLDKFERMLYFMIETSVRIDTEEKSVFLDRNRHRMEPSQRMEGLRMQTIYTTTTHFVRRSGNVVDFQDYRRRLALTQEGSLAPNPREEASRWTEDWTEEPREEKRPQLYVLEPVQEARPSRRERQEHRALVLDVCASLGVVLMTLVFSLQLVLG